MTGKTLLIHGLLLCSLLSVAQADQLKVKPFLAKPFSETDLSGQVQSLEQYEGKPVLLYFWATWCPACRKDLGNLLGAYRELHPKGVEFITVSLDTDRKRIEDFVEDKSIPYPVLYDGGGWENKIARLYDVVSTPTYFIIDGDGRVARQGSWAKNLEVFFE